MLENLNITRVIVHDVVSAAQFQINAPTASKQLATLGADTVRLVCDRLVNATGSASKCEDVTVARSEQRSAFQQLASLLQANEARFISVTEELAAMLSKAQTVGAIKPGVGVFLQGTGDLDGSSVGWVAVIKADPDQGLVKRTGPDGSISWEYVADLILGAQQRLLKVAFMVEVITHAGDIDDLKDPANYTIRVYDHLLSNKGRTEAAVYFYSAFLGCKTAASAPKLTRKFFEGTKGYIDKAFSDPVERVAYRGHLVSYLKSQKRQISCKEFADDYLPKAHRLSFLRQMKESGFPGNSVSKDNSLIENRLRKSSMRFSSKLMIVGPGDLLANGVVIGDQIEKDGEEWTQIAIKGRLEQKQ